MLCDEKFNKTLIITFLNLDLYFNNLKKMPQKVI